MLLIVYPKDGWILERMARALLDTLPECEGMDFRTPGLWDEGSILDTGPQRINYFINYAVMARPSAKADAAWFTHPEDDGVFWRNARAVDLAVCNCDKYRDLIADLGVQAQTIVPGVEDTFAPMLRLGVVGRLYGSGRKGEDLLRRVAKLPFVDLRVSGGELAPHELPAFYNAVDYVLVTSRYEGGPMCLLEGLACGKEIICPPDVGLAGQFPDHVIPYENGDWASLEAVLRTLHARRTDIAKAVEGRTWERWALDHLKLFTTFLRGTP